MIRKTIYGTLLDMARRSNNEWLVNQTRTSLAVFMESYNQSIPAEFPRASAKLLKEFQQAHPTLFKAGDEWSIDRHRKRIMDWLSAHRDESR